MSGVIGSCRARGRLHSQIVLVPVVPSVRDVSRELNDVRRRGLYRIDDTHYQSPSLVLPNLEQLLAMFDPDFDPTNGRVRPLSELLRSALALGTCVQPKRIHLLMGLEGEPLGHDGTATFGMDSRQEIEAIAFGSPRISGNAGQRQAEIATMRRQLAEAAVEVARKAVEDRGWVRPSGDGLAQKLLLELERLRDTGGLSPSNVRTQSCEILLTLPVTETERLRQGLGQEQRAEAAVDAVHCVLDNGRATPDVARMVRATLEPHHPDDLAQIRHRVVPPKVRLKRDAADFEADCYSEFSELLVELEETPCAGNGGSLRPSQLQVFREVLPRLQRMSESEAQGVLDALREILTANAFLSEQVWDSTEVPDVMAAWSRWIFDELFFRGERFEQALLAAAQQRSMLPPFTELSTADDYASILTGLGTIYADRSDKRRGIVLATAGIYIAELETKQVRPRARVKFPTQLDDAVLEHALEFLAPFVG